MIEAPGWRPFLIVSAYGKTGGWNRVTESVLLTIERNLTLQGAKPPFIIAGDFNCEPAIMEEKGMPQRMGATIVASAAARGTFRGGSKSSNIDYFIMSDSISRLVADVKVVDFFRSYGTLASGHLLS